MRDTVNPPLENARSMSVDDANSWSAVASKYHHIAHQAPIRNLMPSEQEGGQ
jgi:hypothetical protein